MKSLFLGGLLLFGAQLAAQAAAVGLVHHAPNLTGLVEGSLQQNLGESVTLNSGAVITGDLLTPGIPTVVQIGNPTFGGTIVGLGSSSPKNYQIILNGSTRLTHLCTRADAQPLPAVKAPSKPKGHRSVTVTSPLQDPGSFASIRNLNLGPEAGERKIPAGMYGDFSAQGNSTFILGTPGTPRPAVYHFQQLTFNGNSRLVIAGPVILNVADGFTCNDMANSANDPGWLMLNIANGGLTLNSGSTVYAMVNTPRGTVAIHSGSQLIGGVTCDRLTVNENASLRIRSGPEGSHSPRLCFRRDALQSPAGRN